jgi:hypothetical protein
MLPRFPGLAGPRHRGVPVPVRPVVPPCPGQAPDALAGSVLFISGIGAGAQTVSAVERTARVASTTKIANQATRPITLTSAAVPWPITSVLILTIW